VKINRNAHKGYRYAAVAESDASSAEWRASLLVLKRNEIIWREVDVVRDASVFRALNAALVVGPALIDRLIESGLC
jgi:hypothetical protein